MRLTSHVLDSCVLLNMVGQIFNLALTRPPFPEVELFASTAEIMPMSKCTYQPGGQNCNCNYLCGNLWQAKGSHCLNIWPGGCSTYATSGFSLRDADYFILRSGVTRGLYISCIQYGV
ncbi:unnamed protein product [Caretta caretta]